MTGTANVSAAERFGMDSPLLVRNGEATLFLAAVSDDGGLRRRLPVVTVHAPALLATREAPDGHRWIVGPGLGSVLEEATLDADERLVTDAVVGTAEALGELLRPFSPPLGERVVRLGRRPAEVPNVHGAVVDATAWVRPLAGVISLAGVPVPAAGVPLAARLTVFGEGDASAAADPIADVPTATLIEGVEWLCAVVAEHVLDAAGERLHADAEAARSSVRRAREAEDDAVRLLAEQLRAKPEPVIAADTDPLVASAIRVLAPSGLEPTVPRAGLGDREGTAAVNALAAASGLYVRRVTLDGAWWSGADEPVLGFREDGAPLALLPVSGGMAAVEADGTAAAVDATTAATILDAGFVFSRPFVDGNVDRRALGHVAVAGRGRAIAGYVGWAAVHRRDRARRAVRVGRGVQVDRAPPGPVAAVDPAGRAGDRRDRAAARAARAGGGANAARDEGRARRRERHLGAHPPEPGRAGAPRSAPATWRCASPRVETARDPVDQTILSVLPNLLTGLLAGLVLFYYDLALAAFVLAAGLLVLGVALLIARSAGRAQEEVETATGAVNGFLFQVLLAIPKVRVAAAESRAFLAWAGHFTSAVGQRLMRAGAREILLTAMIPTLGSLALFAGVAVVGSDSVGVDVFVAFQTTFTVFIAGVTGTITAASTAVQLRPTVDRAIALAQEPVELTPDRAEQATLRGAIAFAGVTFRYLPGTRPVLDELTFRIEPGELVAVTGPSGCGKSTMLRLLLGFEQPQEGSVLYDDQTLSSLDVGAVRRQLGVVLQDGQLMPGTVRQNLVGDGDAQRSRDLGAGRAGRARRRHPRDAHGDGHRDHAERRQRSRAASDSGC